MEKAQPVLAAMAKPSYSRATRGGPHAALFHFVWLGAFAWLGDLSLQSRKQHLLTLVAAHLEECGVLYFADGTTLLGLYGKQAVGGLGTDPLLRLTLPSWEAFRELHRCDAGAGGWRLAAEGLSTEWRSNAWGALRICDAYGVCVRVDTMAQRGRRLVSQTRAQCQGAAAGERACWAPPELVLPRYRDGDSGARVRLPAKPDAYLSRLYAPDSQESAGWRKASPPRFWLAYSWALVSLVCWTLWAWVLLWLPVCAAVFDVRCRSVWLLSDPKPPTEPGRSSNTRVQRWALNFVWLVLAARALAALFGGGGSEWAAGSNAAVPRIDVVIPWGGEKKSTDVRQRDNNELQYALRSFWKHAPWINKIYVLQNTGQPPPSWLNEEVRLTHSPLAACDVWANQAPACIFGWGTF
eukprot:COSAG04_NODE_1105_length_8235_cov_48.668142_1_plen_409_part_00